MTSKFCGMLGLCAKAGKMVYGAFACEKGIKRGKIKLVIVSDDSSDNTKKDFKDSCKFYGVPIIFSCEDVGKAVGKISNKIFGVTDLAFANNLIAKYKEENSGGVKFE